jgi:hypothetical protein
VTDRQIDARHEDLDSHKKLRVPCLLCTIRRVTPFTPYMGRGVIARAVLLLGPEGFHAKIRKSGVPAISQHSVFVDRVDNAKRFSAAHRDQRRR